MSVASLCRSGAAYKELNVNTKGYDLIGDIHGHADKLVALLELMGYRQDGVGYRHPDRQVIFLGDFIDRGPQQRGVLQVVMPMVKSGAALAVMGNHEFNALAFHTLDPHRPGQWLRPRNNKNMAQHLAFLAEYVSPNCKHELDDVLDFFRSLPLWLDLDGLRVVHACWHPLYIEMMETRTPHDNTLTPELLVAASTAGEPAYEAIETLLKGVEIELPDGGVFFDKDGSARSRVRTQWWIKKNSTLGEVCMPIDVLEASIANHPVAASDLLGYPESEKPVFVGHYWLKGQPTKLADNVACLDYSVAKGGKLVAYRWQGEAVLVNEHFCGV
ncbi:MAG: diadenosine tetraphosphatase [Ketobacter sp.]|nr:MAG: diadenosine tetraphosphatase [Ketobacter sp.]